MINWESERKHVKSGGLEFLEKQDAVEAYIGNSFFNAFAGGLTYKAGGGGYYCMYFFVYR